SLTVLLFSVWCLTHGITTIFMHLYYFPIVLLAYRYRWKGFGLATLLSLAYLGLVIVFDPGETDIILGALYRFLVFVGIAAVIAYLSVLLEKAKSTQQQSAELRDRYLSLAPAIVLALDRNGAITYLNRNGGKILECLPEEVTGKSWADRFLPDKERERVNHVFLQILAGQIEPYRVFENPVVSCGGTEKIIRWHNTVLHDENGAITGILGFGEDITEEKWAQDTLLEMQQFQESVITNANVWISVLSLDGTLLVWNDAAEAISGYKKSEVVGKNTVWKQLYPDNEYRKKVTGEIQRIIRRDTFLENFETEIRCADGTKKIIVWNTRGQRDTKGAITSYIAIGRDITKQTEAETEIRHLATFPRLTPVNILESDLSGKILFINPAMENTIAAIGISDPGIFIPADFLKKAGAESSCTTPLLSERELVIQSRTVTLNLSFVPESRSVRVYATDITGRKRTEDALRDNEKKLNRILNDVPDVIWSLSWPDLNIDYISPSAEQVYGRPVQEFIKKPSLWAEVTHPDDKHISEKALEQLRKVGSAVRECRIVRPDGSIVWIHDKSHMIFDEHDTPIRVEGITSDITERKKAEEEIRISNVILKTQQETSPDGILIVDKSGKILSFNQKFTEIWGIPREIIDSRDDEQVLSFVLDKLANPQEFLARVRYLYEHREEKSREEILLKDGKVFERYSAPMLGKDNWYFGRVWYFHDITERKRAEEAIRSREEQFRAIFQTQQTGLVMVDAVTHTIVDANAAALAMIGASHKDVTGKVCHTFICPAEVGKCPVTDLGHTDDNSERVLIRANGERIPILKSVNPVTIGDRPFLIESFVDLTERKQMEKQISESRQLFADIISFLPDPTFVIDKDGKVLAWNRAIEQLSGVPAEDIIGKGDHEYSLWLDGKRRPILIDLVLHPDQDAGRLDYTGIHWDGRTVIAQTEIIRPGSGHTTSLSLVASPLIDAQGNITGAIESMRDISRLKEAEAELGRINQNLEQIVRDRTRLLEDEVAQRMRAEKDVQNSLSYTRSVIEANPDLMVVLDRNGTVLDINATAELLTGIPREQLIGTLYFGYLVDDGTLYDAFSRLLKEGRIENLVKIRHTDGHITPLSINATLIDKKDAPDVRIIVAAHDITRQKQDEEAIKASLEEKVILLREVHHRVKNNLQIIISLVNLQMRQTDDPEVKKIMSETQNRVRAMSLVHEKLYRSESLSRIDFADYTRFLATQLFSFYGSDTRRVRLDFVMGKIMVDINTAVPLGLLMNEIVSNALKHAFPNGREGTISISGSDENNLITLVVRDDGIGIPADLDWKNTTSLGMRLVSSLIDQVDGTVTLDRGAGTSFTIVLKKKD
ncbi:MAG: PAS domain S-box protein, partial [Methanoregula sp.]|nr:PAS domain S-box protein [Methanoregula sp.]